MPKFDLGHLNGGLAQGYQDLKKYKACHPFLLVEPWNHVICPSLHSLSFLQGDTVGESKCTAPTHWTFQQLLWWWLYITFLPCLNGGERFMTEWHKKMPPKRLRTHQEKKLNKKYYLNMKDPFTLIVFTGYVHSYYHLSPPLCTWWFLEGQY